MNLLIGYALVVVSAYYTLMLIDLVAAMTAPTDVEDWD